jgi:hypothetical protein
MGGYDHQQPSHYQPAPAARESFFLFLSFFLTGFLFFINNCFFCRPSDSTVLKDAEIEPRTVVALALADSSVADP